MSVVLASRRTGIQPVSMISQLRPEVLRRVAGCGGQAWGKASFQRFGIGSRPTESGARHFQSHPVPSQLGTERPAGCLFHGVRS